MELTPVIIGCNGQFVDEFFQSVTCTVVCTDNRTRTNQKTKHGKNVKQPKTQVALPKKKTAEHTQKKTGIRQRTNRAWFSRLLQHSGRRFLEAPGDKQVVCIASSVNKPNNAVNYIHSIIIY